MSLKSLIATLIILSVFGLNAQNMNEGFSYLETGQFEKAETFFFTILKEHSENKTAKLCYARALGLNGKPLKAKTIFEDLLKDFPNDFEIKLNYSESLLWNNMFNDAKAYYSLLLKENSESFPALLGFANTLSNLKEYPNAIVYVNKALDASPRNPNALTSKKYIYLGYSYQQQQFQNYKKAEELLHKNLEFFNNDKETLINLANLYLITSELDKAENTYNILSKNNDNKLIALNGLALISHLRGKEKNALKISQEAFNHLNAETDSKLKQQTIERYAQALIWNKKFREANTLVDQLIKDYPNMNWVLALRATLNIYQSDFKKSLDDYNTILKNDSTSFDGNLGKANALKALGQYDNAYQAAETTLTIYNNQKDALNFISNLDNTFTPTLESKVSYNFDNGKNNAIATHNLITVSFSTKFKILGHYSFRKTNNKLTKTKAETNDASLGVAYQILPNLNLKGSLGFTDAETESNDYTQLLADIVLQIKPLKLQVLEVGYKREVQNFNAELLDREIIQNNFYTNYNLNTNFNLGWFAQYYYTSQSDNNTRNLFFTSLYYNILQKPVLKAGLNYQYITFKDQVPELYFSPNKFHAGEVFANIIKDENTLSKKGWYYELTAATGYQFIEDDEKQATYRLHGKLGYKFSSRSFLNMYGTHSNIASATVAGFTFTEIGLRFKWLITNKPLFRN